MLIGCEDLRGSLLYSTAERESKFLAGGIRLVFATVGYRTNQADNAEEWASSTRLSSLINRIATHSIEIEHLLFFEHHHEL